MANIARDCTVRVPMHDFPTPHAQPTSVELPSEVFSSPAEVRGSLDCVICYIETPLKFGLHEMCNHAFCDECLSKWRQAHDTCPLCRTVSIRAIISERLPTDVADKAELFRRAYDRIVTALPGHSDLLDSIEGDLNFMMQQSAVNDIAVNRHQETRQRRNGVQTRRLEASARRLTTSRGRLDSAQRQVSLARAAGPPSRLAHALHDLASTMHSHTQDLRAQLYDARAALFDAELVHLEARVALDATQAQSSLPGQMPGPLIHLRHMQWQAAGDLEAGLLVDTALQRRSEAAEEVRRVLTRVEFCERSVSVAQYSEHFTGDRLYVQIY